ncbi:hypothetical protein FQA47_005147 [Oryzias melastigma]|uniref:Uncharacterized protein n=1 Tax=Oryzias melastigma TaxID=30732 RepID=A0A834FG59_ORYME|nr:hypothetical protein FQA47_005147 [Oryzias melastigma]
MWETCSTWPPISDIITQPCHHLKGSTFQETTSAALYILLFITIYDESSLSVNFEQLFVQVSVPTNMVQIKFKRGQSSKALSPWRNKITEVEFTARRNKKVMSCFTGTMK